MMKELHKDIVNNGLKVTPQRLAILKILRQDRNHPTAEKVHSNLIEEYPAISLTTVYNTLSSFVEAKMVKELDVDPHKKRFDSFMDPHDHFHCRVCDNVYNIDLNSTPLVKNSHNKKMGGHNIDTISINVKGVCRYCEGGDA
jgi:Fur family peroxide stress response transcriptional regulator